MISACHYRDDVAEAGRDVALPRSVIAPRDDGPVGPHSESVVSASRQLDSVCERGRNTALAGIVVAPGHQVWSVCGGAGLSGVRSFARSINGRNDVIIGGAAVEAGIKEAGGGYASGDGPVRSTLDG